MRILIATTHVPFVYGGAEAHAEGLQTALQAAGHEAEIIAVPFKWYPPAKILDHLLACRLLDVTEFNGVPIDRVIGLKFPAYLIPHPNKVAWILHQHRTAYELWDNPLGDLIYYPEGLQVRDAIRQADISLLPEAQALYANSGNVAQRLKTFCDLDAAPLYHPPPHADLFTCAEAEDYLFFPSRLCEPKRQKLVLQALAKTRAPVRIKFAGMPDNPAFEQELNALTAKLKLRDRVEWLGMVSEAEKRSLYARALGVIYPPIDEDYGYVTLEAMLAAKPVITCVDSGGPLEFVRHEETGLLTTPTPSGLAEAFDTLWQNRARAAQWGKRGQELYQSLNITWPHVVEVLTQ